jgi:hypothetical protein
MNKKELETRVDSLEEVLEEYDDLLRRIVMQTGLTIDYVTIELARIRGLYE